jgi:hypothetical protein
VLFVALIHTLDHLANQAPERCKRRRCVLVHAQIFI